MSDIHTKWFGNFRRFELSGVNLSHGSQNWFELSGISRKGNFNGNKAWFEISGGSGNGGFEKSGFHCIHVAQLVV